MQDADNQDFVDLKDKLFPFQREDVERIIRIGAPSHLIANDMGTGKTYEAIVLDAHYRQEHPEGRTLVVAPLSTLSGWAKTYTELTGLRICVINPKNRPRFLDYMKQDKYDVYILHWEALRLLQDDLKKKKWMHIIADEVHRAKNRKAKQTKALKQIKPKYRTAMSGTPVINRPDEIWSILHWMYPKDYTSYWRFYEQYVDYEIGYPGGYHIFRGTKNLDLLREEISKFMTRRTKAEVLPDLPDKYYTEKLIKLGSKQRKAYDAMRKEMIAWVGQNEDQPLVAPIVIARLMRLQQLALAYAEIDEEYEVALSEPSAKLEALRDIILDNPQKPLVVFTQFTKMIDLTVDYIERTCAKEIGKKARIERIDGGTKNRGQIIDDFQNGKINVLIMTIGAGGVGITLTKADTVVFLDRSWSPAINLQAEDRLHRIGQENAVQVIDLIAEETVDRGRMQRLEQKWEIIKSLIDPELQKENAN